MCILKRVSKFVVARLIGGAWSAFSDGIEADAANILAAIEEEGTRLFPA